MEYHLNGVLVPASEASVSVHDRGFRYGDAVRVGLRAYGGTVFEWEANEKRLRRVAEGLGLTDAVPEDLRERVRETLAANGPDDARLDVSITRGTDGGLTPPSNCEPTVLVTIEERPRGGLDGTRTWDEPALVQIVKTRAIAGHAIPASGLTHARLDGVLARRELERASTDAYHADEALVRDEDGHLVGGAASSVFFVADGVLKTPRAEGAAAGVTRDVVLDLAREESFPVETGAYAPADVRAADEAFLTNPTWELRPIARADGVAVGTGPMTQLLTRLFDERIERHHYE
ncbi:aminotransferase class IV [Halococcus sediminicola]|uniref:aminotransferase class IV n=1 Tax=Halococcus sediminicola TaxID=1264579 RepID=UPI000678F5D0|nr:aminotransferase class IV [Halococcus sediminicola]